MNQISEQETLIWIIAFNLELQLYFFLKTDFSLIGNH